MSTYRSVQHVLTITSTLVGVLTVLLLTNGVERIGFADLPTTDPEAVDMSSARLQKVNAIMQRYIDAQKLAGTVTLIAQHGKVVHLEAQG